MHSVCARPNYGAALMNEVLQRQKVIDEARSWIRTPYHSCARVKQVGVDCAQLPAAVYEAAGMIPHIPVDPYSHQWHLHQSKEVYLNMVLNHAREFKGPPQSGDFVLFKLGRVHAHGAIVTQWPHIVHAVSVGFIGVVESNVMREPFAGDLLINRSPRFFTLWGE